MKLIKPPFTMLYPVPVVLVTSADSSGKPNIITIAWTGTVCSDPPMLSISVRPSRYSHQLISESGEFVVNIPSMQLLEKTDYCGVVTGREVDKFQATGLTPVPASKVKAPLIDECPANLECVVKQTLSLGAHDLFIAEIVACHVEETLVDRRGRMDVSLAHPFVYNGNGEYWGVKDSLGPYGLSFRAK